MSELKTKLSIDTKHLKKELNDLEEQADRIIEKIEFIKKEQTGGN